MNASRVSTSVTICLLAMTCGAQSLGEKNLIAQDKTQVAELAAEANKACGTSIPMSVDYASFHGWKEDATNTNQQSPYSFFQNVTEALESVCGTDDGKKSVQAKIKSVTVSHASAESESLQGGAFHYSTPYQGGTSQTIVKWLNGHL